MSRGISLRYFPIQVEMQDRTDQHHDKHPEGLGFFLKMQLDETSEMYLLQLDKRPIV